MFKKVCTCISLTLMLATAAPALSPALPAQARTRAEAVSEEGTGVASGKFTTVNGKTYCRNADGTNRTGWVKEAGSWYYFDLKDGHMRTGWVRDKNKWYYLNSTDGRMATGWLVLNPSGRKYYFRKDGSMVEGPGWAKIGSGRFYFSEYGHVKNAWELVGGKWYYRTADGTAAKNRWILYGGQYYYLTANGSAAVGTTLVNGKKYRFSSSCALLGTAPSGVIAAARAPLTSAGQKSAAVHTDSEVKDAVISKAAETSSGSTKSSSKNTKAASGSAKTSAGSAKTAAAGAKTSSGSTKKAATTAITSVAGKLNDVPESRKQFVLQVANYVRKYAPQYGIKVYSPIIAQAIHESGWGESSLSAKYHNYFGLKCGTLWRGKSVNLSTKEEYSAGTLTTIRSNFRAYDTMEEGVKGYFEFIQLARYSNLKGVTDPRQYLQNIKNDGYATGSQYVDHTMALVNLYNLTQFDK